MLKTLLNAYWLRPETALWRACDIKAMRGFNFSSPSLDIGCGDGVFSFIRAGGVPSEDFDVFSVGNLDAYSSNVDVYDVSSSIDIAISRRPTYQIDVGIDHKPNLLNRACKLGLYRKLMAADANARLPFDDDSFTSVFSNVIYWLDEPSHVLREIRRVLKPRGNVCFLLPDNTFQKVRFRYPILDRGRSDNIKHARSDWPQLIESAGMRVLSHGMHLGPAIVQFWDVGLRPIFPALKKMADSIPSSKLPAIKKEWVSMLMPLLSPLIESDANGTFHCIKALKP